VAAIYFLTDAGRGGSGGYLVSDPGGVQWLQASALKTLVGYPVESVPDIEIGRLHATTPGNVSFSQVSNFVFTTTALVGFPGNSGGPLCVQYTNGTYDPAGIYLGGTFNGVVREIDGSVADLINRASVTANTGANHAGGGAISVAYSSGGVGLGLGSYKVVLGPAGAVSAGAGWKIAQATNTFFFTNMTPNYNLQPGNYTMVFAPVSGYLTPANQSLRIVANELATVTINYQTAVRFSTATLAGGALQVSANANPGAKLAFERSTNLVNWTALTTNTAAGNGLLNFSDPTNNARKAAFYRLRVVP
jgi:hypothetical protein